MRYNPRLITIKNAEQAVRELAAIQADPTGVRLMAPKAVFKTVKLEQVPAKAANLLKQTFLAKGGEVAIGRGCADLSTEFTDVLICATLKQYRAALTQLKLQPWGLPAVAEALSWVLEAEKEGTGRHYEWKNRHLDIMPGRTLVMGILNVTPDSFSDGGKYAQIDTALRHAEEMMQEGADILDIGAESTRPYGGSEPVSAEMEMERLLPVLEKLLDAVSLPISVDTYKAATAREALRLGAHIINDVWGLQQDPGMAATVADADVPVVVMHNRTNHNYTRDIMAEVNEFLWRSIEIATAAGIQRSKLIVDPGIGFGKTPAQNLTVMSRLEELAVLGCPVLLGTSRKRFIGEVLDLPVADRVEGTCATLCAGVAKGAAIVRVHDVKPAVRTVRMMDALQGGKFDE